MLLTSAHYTPTTRCMFFFPRRYHDVRISLKGGRRVVKRHGSVIISRLYRKKKKQKLQLGDYCFKKQLRDYKTTLLTTRESR